MANPWFRAYTDMVDDEKLRLLAFEDRWHFVALLCCKGSGLLDAGDNEALRRRKLAVKLGLAARELEEVARRLSEVGLIDFETLQPMAWDARQFQSDSSTARVKAYRDRMKRPCNVSGTAQDTDTDTDTDTKSEKKQKPVQPPAAPCRFLEFWRAYPNPKGKQEAEKSWRKLKLDSRCDELIAHVRLMDATDSDWQRGYAPMGSTYLNQARWEDVPKRPPIAAPTAAPGKTMQALQALEDMKNGLAHPRNSDRLPEVDLPRIGSAARR